MTKQGALQYLGLTEDELLAHEDIQRLLIASENNTMNYDSLFEAKKSNGNRQMHKICNLQVLLGGSKPGAFAQDKNRDTEFANQTKDNNLQYKIS